MKKSQPTFEPLTIIQQECFQSIKPLFERNYETINRQPINERTFCTKIMKHPSDDVLKVIDQLAKRKLSQIEKPELLRHKCFIIHCRSYYEKSISTDLKGELYRKNPRKLKCHNG